MTIRIQNLTSLLYGWFIGMLYMIPNIIDILINSREEWIMLIFYLGCFVFFISFVVERYKAILALDESSSFQLLFKREIVFAIILTITTYFLGYL